jgi:hypothetical protein
LDGYYAFAEDGALLLSAALAGPELYHPLESHGPIPPLDRWRRAAASVLEGAALLELARRTGSEPALSDWRWVGAAIYAADTVAPSLALSLPDLALAIQTGDLGANPRAGVAAYQAWRQSGTDPVHQAQYLIDGGIVSAAEWIKLGGWVLDPTGAASRLPLPIQAVSRRAVPTMMPPWSWGPVRVAAHPRGYAVVVDGPGALRDPWAAGGRDHDTLAGGTESASFLELEPGGPVGTWEVASAEAFGQIVGARGIQFTFHVDGRLTLLLTDAFVGPLAAVAMADELGASGVTDGRWAVAGPHMLSFANLKSEALPLMGRGPWRFANAATSFGLPQWISALEEGPWAWRIMPDRLVLRGSMRGGTVEVRLRPTPL